MIAVQCGKFQYNLSWENVGCLAFSMYFANTMDESQTVVPRFNEFGSCQSLKVTLSSKKAIKVLSTA